MFAQEFVSNKVVLIRKTYVVKDLNILYRERLLSKRCDKRLGSVPVRYSGLVSPFSGGFSTLP